MLIVPEEFADGNAVTTRFGNVVKQSAQTFTGGIFQLSEKTVIKWGSSESRPPGRVLGTTPDAEPVRISATGPIC